MNTRIRAAFSPLPFPFPYQDNMAYDSIILREFLTSSHEKLITYLRGADRERKSKCEKQQANDGH